MPFSLIYGDLILDLRFKKLANGLQAFYFGDMYFGQVVKMRGGWSAISKDPYPFMPVAGFKTRLDAVEFVLALWRIKQGKQP